jgi:hypothetical protein
MSRWIISSVIVVFALGAAALPAQGADDSKVQAATKEVETGAKKIGDGRIGEGVEKTAKGIGHTVVEGAKLTGEKLKESGKAAEPKAKSAWESTRDGAAEFGQSVKSFFSRLFGS